jgi:hypothetical protein
VYAEWKRGDRIYKWQEGYSTYFGDFRCVKNGKIVCYKDNVVVMIDPYSVGDFFSIVSYQNQTLDERRNLKIKEEIELYANALEETEKGELK